MQVATNQTSILMVTLENSTVATEIGAVQVLNQFVMGQWRGNVK